MLGEHDVGAPLQRHLGDDLHHVGLDDAHRLAQCLLQHAAAFLHLPLAVEHLLLELAPPLGEGVVGQLRALAGEFLKLFKQSPVAKIDGVQAMLTGMARMEAPQEAPARSFWEQRA